MANTPDPKTGLMARKYTEEQYDLAIDTYIMYGEQGLRGAGKAASEVSGIPVDSIKQEAKKRGIKIASKQYLEKYRASQIESRRIYLRSKMLDALETIIERINSPYTEYKRAGNFGFDKLIYEEGPPARELDKLVNALVTLNAAMRTELGELNTPVVKVEAPQQVNNSLNILNFEGLDAETRNKALKGVADKLLQQQVEPEAEVVDGEVEEEE